MRLHPLLFSAFGLLGLLHATPVAAHCDGLDGPVVGAAREALASGRIEKALIWIPRADEPELRAVFTQTQAVRKLGPQALAVADRHFFETVVRLHRAAEGEGFTGLKPAGRDVGPAIPAADRALATGNVEPLLKLLAEAVRHSSLEHYRRAAGLRKFPEGDVEAGRRYVAAYVAFIHLVERLHEVAGHAQKGHGAEPNPAAGHHEAARDHAAHR